MGDYVDHRDPAVELAGENRRAPVSGEVAMVDTRTTRDRRLTPLLPRPRVVPHQHPQPLGDRDGEGPVRGEVQVVRVHHGDLGARLARRRIERQHGVAPVVGGIQRAQVIGGHHVLQLGARRVSGDDLEAARVDHPHVTGLAVRHVHQLLGPLGGGREHPPPGRGVDVALVGHGRHSRQRGQGRHRRGRCRCQDGDHRAVGRGTDARSCPAHVRTGRRQHHRGHQQRCPTRVRRCSRAAARHSGRLRRGTDTRHPL